MDFWIFGDGYATSRLEVGAVYLEPLFALARVGKQTRKVQTTRQQQQSGSRGNKCAAICFAVAVGVAFASQIGRQRCDRLSLIASRVREDNRISFARVVVTPNLGSARIYKPPMGAYAICHVRR